MWASLRIVMRGPEWHEVISEHGVQPECIGLSLSQTPAHELVAIG